MASERAKPRMAYVNSCCLRDGLRGISDDQAAEKRFPIPAPEPASPTVGGTGADELCCGLYISLSNRRPGSRGSRSADNVERIHGMVKSPKQSSQSNNLIKMKNYNASLIKRI